MLEAIKEFFLSVIAAFVWLVTVCVSGLYILGAFVLSGLFVLGAIALPLLPLFIGIWLISLLF